MYIKPSHRGLFTRKAKAHGMSVEEYAHYVMAHSSGTKLREEANFAINAEHHFHKREDGGPILPGEGYLVGERGPEYLFPTKEGHHYAIPSRTLDSIFTKLQDKRKAKGNTQTGNHSTGRDLASKYGTGANVSPLKGGLPPGTGPAGQRHTGTGVGKEGSKRNERTQAPGAGIDPRTYMTGFLHGAYSELMKHARMAY